MQGRQTHIRPILCCIRCHQLGIMTRMEKDEKGDLNGSISSKQRMLVVQATVLYGPPQLSPLALACTQIKMSKTRSKRKLPSTEVRLRSATCTPMLSWKWKPRFSESFSTWFSKGSSGIIGSPRSSLALTTGFFLDLPSRFVDLLAQTWGSRKPTSHQKAKFT